MEDEELDNIIVLNDEQGNEVQFEFLDLVEPIKSKVLIQYKKGKIDIEQANFLAQNMIMRRIARRYGVIIELERW